MTDELHDESGPIAAAATPELRAELQAQIDRSHMLRITQRVTALEEHSHTQDQTIAELRQAVRTLAGMMAGWGNAVTGLTKAE